MKAENDRVGPGLDYREMPKYIALPDNSMETAMPSRKPRYFLLDYYDDDAKTYNSVGPITDDTDVIERTAELRMSGRKVHISTSNPEIDISKLPAIDQHVLNALPGYKRDHNLKW